MEPEEYRKLAEVEDEMWYFRALHTHVERALSAALGERLSSILDAGCGTGGLIVRLSPRHPRWRWSGIDASELACDLARRRILAIFAQPARAVAVTPETENHAGATPAVQAGSVTAIPFEDGGFDAVVSADVLYHVDDDEGALREFFRILHVGGFVVLNVPAYRWLWSYHDVAVHSRRRYGRAELVRKMAAAGFEVVSVTHWNTLALPLVVLRRKLIPAPRGGSDVRLYPPPIELAFNIAMAVERALLAVVGGLPCGTSIFAIGRKPGI